MRRRMTPIHCVDRTITTFRLSGHRSARDCYRKRGADMDLYHVWCNLKPGVRDVALIEGARRYLGHLKSEGLIEDWRLTRRTLGLAPPGLGEFHVIIETRDLAQLDAAFRVAASRREPVEGFHFGVNSLVQDAVFALYRDFPDPGRPTGEERF